MAQRKKAEQAKSQAADTAKAQRREDLLKDGGGCDWGWPSVEMFVGNDQLTRRFTAGGFSGCGYAALPNAPPAIVLVGDNLDGMKSALELMRGWTEQFGPNAIRLELAYDGPGYVFAVSQQVDLMRWRLAGLDTVLEPVLFAMTHMKRLDSRHPFVEQLAEYAKSPVSPVLLTVATLPDHVRGHSGPMNVQITPDLRSSVWLPGIDVYTDPSQRPHDSMVRISSEMGKSTKSLPSVKDDVNPSRLRSRRENSLRATFPKTLHVLRNHRSSSALFENEIFRGCARWQIEQAVCNVRLRDFLSYRPRSTAKYLEMIRLAKDVVMEPASASVDPIVFLPSDIAAQVNLDALFLLRRLETDKELPGSLEESNRVLRELGYV